LQRETGIGKRAFGNTGESFMIRQVICRSTICAPMVKKQACTYKNDKIIRDDMRVTPAVRTRVCICENGQK
jgi:hypothetical protein